MATSPLRTLDYKLPQRDRLIALAFYVILLCLLCWAATGEVFPPFNERGVWFFSGLFAFLTGALLEAPNYTPPKQGVAWAIVPKNRCLSSLNT